MVIWSGPAKMALQNIFYFIAEDSKFYAKKVVAKIIARSEYLVEFPRLGKIVQEINNDKIRELIIYSYRMIYEIKKMTIYIFYQ